MAKPAIPTCGSKTCKARRALAWVRERNAQARRVLEAHPDFFAMRERIRAVLDSRDRIPAVTRRGDWLYNFWQDADNPRGLWRRTTLDEYRKAAAALGHAARRRCARPRRGRELGLGRRRGAAPAGRARLVKLSRGGADAVVVREFDIATRRFVADGFVLPEAKCDIGWLDADTVLVGTDFGPGSLTDSGYPRVVKRWRRGQPLAHAATVFEGEAQDVSAWFHIDRTPGYERTCVGRSLDFYNSRMWRWLRRRRWSRSTSPTTRA